MLPLVIRIIVADTVLFIDTMQRDEESATTSPNIEKIRPTLARSDFPNKQALQVSAYSIPKEGILQECELEDAVAPPSDGESYWIDADVTHDGQDPVHLRQKIIDKLSLSPFLKRHLSVSQMQRPQVLALSHATLLVVRIFPANEKSSEIFHAAALCLKGLLLTITAGTEGYHRRRLLKDDTMRRMTERELPEPSATGALTLWLSFHLDKVAIAANRLRTRIFAAHEKMDRNVVSVSLAEIIDLKDSLLHILSVAEEQNECMQSLAAAAEGHMITEGIDFGNLKGFLGVLLSTAGSTERAVLRLEKRVADLRQTYDAHQQDRINRRLAVLTILSAVFLPLTLMAGIWGMNFSNMPELQRENAYFYALAAMAVVAISFPLFCYYHGWLTQ